VIRYYCDFTDPTSSSKSWPLLKLKEAFLSCDLLLLLLPLVETVLPSSLDPVLLLWLKEFFDFLLLLRWKEALKCELLLLAPFEETLPYCDPLPFDVNSSNLLLFLRAEETLSSIDFMLLLVVKFLLPVTVC
jgi:hypothetical protein